ncbi:adenylosuccinate synthetase [Cerasicoccus frondis]|uniref:adenylosuccinate synthetase n=1 Tax=Cerasicoccus frondis TaxID=490090 RepID=UPI002852BC44|nr:adenylosuccinate synthetase [Cerasicoccus frondis]
MALTPFSSRLIADVGVSMGDEGKGRLIPEVIAELTEQTGDEHCVGIVMKVNGGANSGHTAGGLKLNLLPAGVVDRSVRWLAIGSGVVADPRKALWELKPLEAKGYNLWERLVFDQRTMVSDLSHRLLDLAWEDYRVNVLKGEARGSTGRGITPAYLDEVGQMQIFYGDLSDTPENIIKLFRERLERAVSVIRHVCQVSPEAWSGFFDTLTNAEQRANKDSIEAGIFPASEFDFTQFRGEGDYGLNVDRVIEVYMGALKELENNIADVRELVIGNQQAGKYLVGEFGQSYWLDKRAGFSPNVTASHTFTPELFQSAGIPAQPVHTIGCCKAYDTKVGTHIFLTKMDDEAPLTIALKKLEFGVSTGRQRMVGWFDAVEKGDCLRFGGYQDLVINKLDALTQPDGGSLKVCVAYQDSEGKVVNYVPREDSYRKTLTPIYEELEGWTEDISTVRSFGDLPAAAQRYIAFCAKATLDIAGRGGSHPPLNVRYVGVGPDPSQIIKDVPEITELLKLA